MGIGEEAYHRINTIAALRPRGYCYECNRRYPDPSLSASRCPQGHDLRHGYVCVVCGHVIGYWQTNDDYEDPICLECITRRLEEA